MAVFFFEFRDRSLNPEKERVITNIRFLFAFVTPLS